MRPRILDNGHSLSTKALFALIRTMSRQPVLDVVRLVNYRADFYGKPMGRVAQEAMRGPSSWTVGDRELMAAFIAKTSQSPFCLEAHAAAAQRASGDAKSVSAVLSDPGLLHVEEPLRATLLLLGKLTREETVDADDMRAVLAAGASRQQIEDALAVGFAFHTMTRLADAFAFSVPGSAAFAAGAKYLLARGYR